MLKHMKLLKIIFYSTLISTVVITILRVTDTFNILSVLVNYKIGVYPVTTYNS